MALVRLPLQPSPDFGPVRSLWLWCGAHFGMHASCNPLVTLGLSDHSRCGTVLIFIVKEILCRDLGTEVSSGELAQRSCTESSYGDLVITQLLSRDVLDLAKRFLAEIFPTELL